MEGPDRLGNIHIQRVEIGLSGNPNKQLQRKYSGRSIRTDGFVPEPLHSPGQGSGSDKEILRPHLCPPEDFPGREKRVNRSPSEHGEGVKRVLQVISKDPKAPSEQFSPDKVSVRLASYKGENIAGILLFRFRDRVSAEFMVMDECFLSVSPNHLLFWEAIKETWEKKYRIFDFGRTRANNASLLDFKRRWGTQEVDLPIYYHPVEMKDYMQKKEGAIAYKVSKLVTSAIPSGMFRQFGQWFYRHLG
jgi:hypothetical protein